MNVRFVRFLVVAAALILVGVVSAQAQTPTVDIKFKFQANGTLLEAGTYSVDFGSNGNLMLTPAKGGAAIEVPKAKTLGGRNVRKVEMVFDGVGSLLFLSEAWLPGRGGVEVSRANTDDRVTVAGATSGKQLVVNWASRTSGSPIGSRRSPIRPSRPGWAR